MPCTPPNSPSHQSTYLFFLPDQSCLTIQSLEIRSLNVFYLIISINTWSVCVSVCVCVCVCGCVFVCVCVSRERSSYSEAIINPISFFLSWYEYNLCTKQFYIPGKVIIRMFQNDDEKQQQWIWPQWYGMIAISIP